MVTTVTFSDFVDAFEDMNREDNFSYEGKQALFDYLREYEEATGEAIELDIIAICCEYTEYSSVGEFIDDGYYGVPDPEDFTTSADFLSELHDWLNDRTQVVACEDDCILVASF